MATFPIFSASTTTSWKVNMSLKHAILVLLETEEGSGYDLLKRFKQRLGFFWNASHQQIYQQLKKMHEEKLIALSLEPQSGKPDRKVYNLTQEGRNELAHWISEPVKPNKVNDALLVKLYAAHLTEPEAFLQELARHKEIHSHMLETFLAIEKEYLSLPADKQAPYKLPYLTLRRGILGEQAWLQWAEEVTQAFC